MVTTLPPSGAHERIVPSLHVIDLALRWLLCGEGIRVAEPMIKWEAGGVAPVLSHNLPEPA